MEVKILVAPYTFKGTLSSVAVADAIVSGVNAIVPHASILIRPLGDGGAGTLDALMQGIGGCVHSSRCTQADSSVRESRWGVLSDGRAVVEAAGCISLADVPMADRNPGSLTTAGLGELMIHAVAAGASSLVVGLGDTATHDCGIGMASVLGYRFRDADGAMLTPVGTSLINLRHIESEHVPEQLKSLSCLVLCDVMNPLVGEDGAARRFAPQKGADAEAVALLEAGTMQFAEVVERELGIRLQEIPGAGAGGGLGAGLHAIIGAELVSGAKVVLEAIGFDGLLRDCDFVITGEGRVDRKTLLGKGVAHIARQAAAANKRCVVVTGGVEGEIAEFEAALRATIVTLRQHGSTAEESRAAISEAVGRIALQ